MTAKNIAFAQCPDLYDRIRQEALQTYRTSLTCADLEHVNRLLPLITSSAGEWGFAGEQELRAELRGRFGAHLPLEILPIGMVERRAPGGKRILLVFGIHMPWRLKGVILAVQTPPKTSRHDMAARLGQGALYDRIGVYTHGHQRLFYPSEGFWLEFGPGGAWKRHQQVPDALRTCLRCQGWLCPKDALVCFSDFNYNQREEIHLTDNCANEICTLHLLEPDGKGSVQVLLQQPRASGIWQEDAQGWALVPRRPSCGYPMAYRLDRQRPEMLPDPILLEAVYPASARRVDCWDKDK